MYAAVRLYDGVTDTKEAAKRVAEGFVPIVKGVPGFVAYYFVDAGNGVMISTSIFKDKAGAEESTRRAGDWVKNNMTAIAPKPPMVSNGEVVADAKG